MARTFSSVDENGSFGRAIRVVVRDADAFEAVELLKLVAGFFGVAGFGVRID